MNKIIVTICTLCMLCISCTSSQVNYKIKSTVNEANGEKVYLSVADAEGDKTVIDSTTVSENSFTFKGTQPKICFALLSIGKMETIVVLENGTINVSLDNHGKVTGTPTNDILNACNEKISILENEFMDLLKQEKKLKQDQKDEIAALKRKVSEVFKTQKSVIKECINQNLNNIVGAYLLGRYERYLSNEEITEILAVASPVMKENNYAKEVIEHKEAIEHAKIGQKFTDFKLKDPNDKKVSLSDYVGKGKYVLLEFWASWCGPCRGEMPNVKAAYEKFKSKEFEIVGVSLDDKKEAWLKGIQDLGITWPQMSDLKGWKCKGAKTYDVHGIPSIFLFDPDGIIIAKDLRGEEIEKKLSEVLK